MTIRFRNRLNLALLLITITVFAANLAFFVFCMIKHLIVSQEVLRRENIVLDFLFGYKPYFTYASIFILNIFSIIFAFFSLKLFENTQSSEICFLFLFIIACTADTSRLYIPYLTTTISYSEFTITIGDISLFSRILAPLSLLFSAIRNDISERQNIEQNMTLILALSIFLATSIPLNTGLIENNFRILSGYNRIIKLMEVLIYALTIISLFIQNIKNEFSQKTTIGLSLIIAGYISCTNGTFFIGIVLSLVCFFLGSKIYLGSLHNQYQYN